jgi:hypothetical protein
MFKNEQFYIDMSGKCAILANVSNAIYIGIKLAIKIEKEWQQRKK